MLTSIRGLTAATFAGAFALSTPAFASESEAAPADATTLVVTDFSAADLDRAMTLVDEAKVNYQDSESEFELSGNVALVSDYRFRGVSFSGGDFALQGGIDLAHSSGFYVGTWASTIDANAGFGEMELDVYGGWGGDISDGVSVDFGLLYYLYPTEDTGADTDYFEALGSIGTTIGPVGATFGVGYSWDQASLGDSDNLYLYTDFEAGIGDSPVTLTAHLGYTDGVFATQEDGTSFDWGLGASYALTDSLSIGFNYVDTQGPSIDDFTDAGFFFTLGYSM